MTFDYLLCGWRVTSAVPLPELLPWQGDVEDRPTDLTVEIGKLPPLDAAATGAPGVHIDKAGSVQFRAQGVADYHLGADGRIILAPEKEADPGDVRLFLWSSGLPYLMHQRRVAPVQAASVVVDGQAVLLCSAPQSGKSVLADGFARFGHGILSDSIAALDLAGARCLPVLPQLLLWEDCLSSAGHDVDLLVRARAALPRYRRPLRADERGMAAPPIALFHLTLSNDAADPIVAPLRGNDRIGALARRMLASRSLSTMAGATGAMRRLAMAAASVPHHFTLTWPRGLDRVGDCVEAVVATVRAQATGR